MVDCLRRLLLCLFLWFTFASPASCAIAINEELQSPTRTDAYDAASHQCGTTIDTGCSATLPLEDSPPKSSIGHNADHRGEETRSAVHHPHGVEDDSSSDDNVGWHYEPYGHPYDTERCNIPRRSYDDVTQEEFERDYYLKRPILFTPNVERTNRIRQVRRHWSKKHFIEQHGKFQVTLGTPQQLTAYGEGQLKMTLEEYIKEMSQTSSSSSNQSVSLTHYMFDRTQFLASCHELLDSYTRPRFFQDSEEGPYSSSLTFALGPTGTGINFHYHKDGWNEVIHGRKRWLFYPPTIGVPPNGYNQWESAKSWFDLNYHRLSASELPFECVQYPGETMYVPEDWYHATLNIGDTLALAGQSKQPFPGTLMAYVLEGLRLGELDDGGGHRRHRKESRQQFRSALKKFPKFAQVYNLLGNSYRGEGRNLKAKEAYEKAVEYNPLYAMAWSSLGQIQLQKHDYDSALSSLLRANELGKDFYATLLGLGNALYLSNEPTKAIPILERSIEVANIKEQHSTSMTTSGGGGVGGGGGGDLQQAQASFVNLCIIYTSLNQFDHALSISERWLNKFPDDILMLMSYGSVLRKLNRFEDASKIYQRILSKQSDYQFALKEREITLKEEMEYRKRITLMEQKEQITTTKTKTSTTGTKKIDNEQTNNQHKDLKKSSTNSKSASSTTTTGSTSRVTSIDRNYLSDLRSSTGDGYLPFEDLSLRTVSALRGWRRELVNVFLTSMLRQSTVDATTPKLHVVGTYTSVPHDAKIFTRTMKVMRYQFDCLHVGSSKSYVSDKSPCLPSGGKIIPSFGEVELNTMLGENMIGLLTIGVQARTILQHRQDWFGLTSFQAESDAILASSTGTDGDGVDTSDSTVHTFLSRIIDMEQTTSSSTSISSNFVTYLESLPRGYHDALIGLDPGTTSSRRPEHQFYETLDETMIGSTELIQRVLKKLGIDTLPSLPRGIAFHSFRIVLSRSSLESLFRFIVLFLDALFDVDILPKPRTGSSLNIIFESLPMIWSILTERPLIDGTNMEYIHESTRQPTSASTTKKKDGRQLEQHLNQLFERFVEKHGSVGGGSTGTQRIETWKRLFHEEHETNNKLRDD